jgi:phosphoribosyl 1,2-cyclic phosphodiesterase
MTLTFHGVRGSTPCHGREIARYGGNTSCVSIAVPGHDPLLCDLGTGLRYFGLTCDPEAPFSGTCLLSHLHWDHVQGLPFFTPLLRDGAQLTIYSPHPEHGGTVAEVMAETIKPPLFPVTLDQLAGDDLVCGGHQHRVHSCTLGAGRLADRGDDPAHSACGRYRWIPDHLAG